MRLRNPIELTVFMDGKFVRASEAKVSIFDHCFLFGDGIQEEMRTYDGGIFAYIEHFNRLTKNARYMGLDIPMGCRAIYKTIKILLQQNYLHDAHVRIILSRGSGVPFIDPSFSPENTFCVIASDCGMLPDQESETGIDICVLDESFRLGGVNPDGHDLRHCSMISEVLAMRELRRKEAFEGIFANREGFIADGIRSNIFVYKDDTLLTPEAGCGSRGGIGHKTILKIAAALKIEKSETFLTIEDLYAAQECFLVSSTWGIIPVVTVDGQEIGQGKVGQFTKYLKRQYRKHIISDIINTEKMLD